MKTLATLTTAAALCAAFATATLHAQDRKPGAQPAPKQGRGPDAAPSREGQPQAQGQQPREPREGGPGAPRDFNTSLLNELRSKLTPEQLKHVEEALQRVGPPPMARMQWPEGGQQRDGGPQAGPRGDDSRRPGGEGQPPRAGGSLNDRGGSQRGPQLQGGERQGGERQGGERPQGQPQFERNFDPSRGERPPAEGSGRNVGPQNSRPSGPQSPGGFDRGDRVGRSDFVPPMQQRGGVQQENQRQFNPPQGQGQGGPQRQNFNPPGSRGGQGPGNINPPFRRDGASPQGGPRPEGPQQQFRGGQREDRSREGGNQPGESRRFGPPQRGPQNDGQRPPRDSGNPQNEPRRPEAR